MQVKKIACIVLFLVTICFPSLAFAQNKETAKTELAELKQQILELQAVTEEVKSEEEADYLRKLAESLAGKEEEPKKTPEETVFKFGGLSLQKLNPEIMS